MAIDLSEFESKVRVRQVRPEDFDAIVALQERCFPGMKTWSREQFNSQLAVFPEGQVCVEIDGRVVASSASLIVAFADYADWHDWNEISDKGLITNHDPEGDTLYGIEMQVDPEFRGMKLARRLYSTRKEICRERNLARIVIGGRIPGYAAHAGEMTAQGYVDAVVDKRLFDPVLTSQLANGFVLKELIPDYLPSDEDSGGFATYLEWANLDYRPPRTGRTRRAVHSVRAALVQYLMRPIDTFEEFARQCEFFVDTAADHRADFLLFPELFTLQLQCLMDGGRPGAAARALTEFTPRYLELFQDFAVRYDVNIIGGSQFAVEGDALYNIAYLFRRDGSIDQQKKIHVTPNEAKWWGIQGGDSVKVFDTDRGRIAILICYDVEFPELVRFLAAQGAHILFVPYNTNDRYGHLRVQICAQARAIENHLYVVTAGCTGNLPFVENADTHYAQSAFYTPSDISFARDGIAAQTSANVEMVLVHDLDTEIVRRHRRIGTVQNFNDRRTDLYRVRWVGPGEPRDV